MSVIAGIHIFTDRKAKILTSLKAALHQAEELCEKENPHTAGEMINDSVFKSDFNELEGIIGNAFYNELAIVLFDYYISILFEDAEADEKREKAEQYSETFEKPVFITLMCDSESIVFGAADRGKTVTMLSMGEDFDDPGIESGKINMDYFSFIFIDKNLTDLNRLDSAADIVYALEEDYGIFADLSPVSIPLFVEKYKLLEESKSFSVYSTL